MVGQRFPEQSVLQAKSNDLLHVFTIFVTVIGNVYFHMIFQIIISHYRTLLREHYKGNMELIYYLPEVDTDATFTKAIASPLMHW